MAASQQFLDRIPNEQEVRARLAENVREAAVLRSLLRLAKKKTEATARRSSSEGREVARG
jgi:hypothetical protein